MTLFTSLDTLDVPYVAPLIGCFLLDGWKAVFRSVLALLDAVAGDLVHGTCPRYATGVRWVQEGGLL